MYYKKKVHIKISTDINVTIGNLSEGMSITEMYPFFLLLLLLFKHEWEFFLFQNQKK